MSNDLRSLGSVTDLFTIMPDWSNRPSDDFDFANEQIQYDLARTVTRVLSQRKPFTIDYKFTNLDKQREYELLDFFGRMLGRSGSFWLPYWFQNFELQSPISTGAGSLLVNDYSYAVNGVRDYFRFFIRLRNGDYITRKIVAFSDLGGGIKRYYVHPFDRNITLSDVLFFGRLMLMRFDQDEIEMNHETPSVSSCSIKFRELVWEYPLVQS